MPSILFINRIYPPDSGATGRVLEKTASAFVRAGWHVTILATADGKADPGMVEQNGVRVVRVGVAFSKASLLARAAGYLLMIPSLLLKALCLPRADFVVTMTDPPMLLVTGPLLRIVKGSKLVHWAQDLYPEVAEAAGLFRSGGIVAGMMRALSTASMRSHHLIVSPGRCMSDRLSSRGMPTGRVKLIPNIGMECGIVPVSRGNNPFRTRHAIPPETLSVMYSGNLGRAHEFDTILEAARLLKDKGDEHILFLFVGEGPSRPSVERDATLSGLTNVRFLPSQPESEISTSLGSADLHLVTMRGGMSGLVVPSKFYGVLAAQRPCLFVGPEDSEVARVIREVGCGEVVALGDGAGVAEAIRNYRNHSQRLADEGRLGRSWLDGQHDVGSEFLGCVETLR